MSVHDDELDLEDDGFVPATNPTKEDYEAVVARNRKLFARAKKAESKKRETTETVTPSTTTAPAAAPTEDAAWRERMELKTEGYNDEEIAFIQQSGGRKALENAHVKAAIESMRSQKKAETAAVDTTAGKSEIEKQYTDAQLREMPTKDLEKILPKAQQ